MYLTEVSVVIPNKDRTDLLYRAVDSVLSQTFQDFEIIVVDDSSDTNFNEIKEHLSKDPRIRVIRGEQKDEIWARKLGFDFSAGKYVALLDSDDYWEPEKLSMQIELFHSDNRIGVVWDKMVQIDDRTMKREMIEPPFREADICKCNIFSPYDISKQLVLRNFIHSSCGTVDREKLIKIGGFPIIRPVDYILWLRMSESYHFGLVPYCLTNRFFTSTSLGRRKRLLYMDLLCSFPVRSRLLFHIKVGPIYKMFVIMYMFSQLTGFTVFMSYNWRRRLLETFKLGV